jgi:hyperosmotically inducible protein
VTNFYKSLNSLRFSDLAWPLRKRGQVALKALSFFSHYKDIIMQTTKTISTLVTAAFLTAVAAPVVYAADASETSSPPAAQKAGAYVDDSVITAKVKAAFVEDSQVSALKIKVTTKTGIVTLAGTVPNAEAGQHALQVAAAIDGVKDVKSALTVKAS